MITDLKDLKTRAKLPANKAGGGTVAAFFESNKASLVAVLPSHIGADRMLRLALTALRTTPKLMECTVESLMGAVMQCASMGLEPNTVQGHAFLVPFKKSVQVIIGYRGLIDLARRSGQIMSIAAHAVYENDDFVFQYGLLEKLNHTPKMGDRGTVIGYYAVAHLVGGGHAFEVMSADEINVIMLSTQSKGGYGPWKDHPIEMGRKTAIRRLAKYLPMSVEMANAIGMGDMTDRGEEQNMGDVLTGSWANVTAGDNNDDPPPVVYEASQVGAINEPEPASGDITLERKAKRPSDKVLPSAKSRRMSLPRGDIE